MSTIPFFTIRCHQEEREMIRKVLQFTRSSQENRVRLQNLLQGWATPEQDQTDQAWRKKMEDRLAKLENWVEMYEKSFTLEEELLEEIKRLPDEMDDEMYQLYVRKLEALGISDDAYHEGMALLEQKHLTNSEDDVLHVEDVTDSWGS